MNIKNRYGLVLAGFLLLGRIGNAAWEDLGTLVSDSGKTYTIKLDESRMPRILQVNGARTGYYRVIDRPSRINGSRIEFDQYSETTGNVIHFTDLPPAEMELDNAQVIFQPGEAPTSTDTKNWPDIGRVVPNPALEESARTRLISREWKRVVESFNLGWTFALADETTGELAEQISSNRWRRVDLPHDWSIEHAVDQSYLTDSSGGFTRTGLGWYRKTFTVPDEWKDRRVFIDFGGIYMNSDVWINGHWLGNRPYGFSSFRYDLTSYLVFGQNNEIKVRVDNHLQRSARWYTGSGIYRDVKLVVTDPVHVGHWGTYVQPQSSNVTVQTTLVNSMPTEAVVSIRSSVDGSAAQNSITIPGLSERIVTQVVAVVNPKLWSAEDPNLYSLVTEVQSGANTCDQYATPVGFRTIVFDPDLGISVNGKATELKGVCVHEDGGGTVGAAISADLWERRFKILKEMGCNAVRCSHNPFFEEFYELADRMGLYVIDEAFDEWRVSKREYSYSLHFNTWAERDLRDMLRRDRNHPSIIAWSIGNEIRDLGYEHSAATADFLITIIKQMDIRPTTQGFNHYKEANENGITDALDWVGYNFAHRDDRYQSERAAYPKRKIYGSETTHSMQTRGVYRTQTDKWSFDATKEPNLTEKEIFSFNEEYSSSYDNCFKEMHNRGTLVFARDTPWMAGEFRWTGFDYLGESGPWPSRFKSFGIIDMCGFPKDTYYLYQSVWNQNTNVLHILPHWNWPGMEGVTIPVWVYANHCDKVELFVNGVSAGKKRYDDKELYVTWDVAYAPGQLRAVSYRGGQVVKETILKTAGAPAKVGLVVDKTTVRPNQKDLIHAEIRILDADGNFVPDASNQVHVTIQGPAKQIGLDGGDPLNHEDLKDARCKVFNGMGLAVIQSQLAEGKIVITVSAEGLESAQATVSSTGSVPVFHHGVILPANTDYEISSFEKSGTVPEAEKVRKKKNKKK